MNDEREAQQEGISAKMNGDGVAATSSRDFLFRERLEPSTEDFDVDLGSRRARAGFRQSDFGLEKFSFCAGEFVRGHSAVRGSARER